MTVSIKALESKDAERLYHSAKKSSGKEKKKTRKKGKPLRRASLTKKVKWKELPTVLADSEVHFEYQFLVIFRVLPAACSR